MGNLINHAENELRLAGLVGKGSAYDGMVAKAVLGLVRKLSDQGHSGMSASITLQVFDVVARYKLLSKIQQPKEGDWNVINDVRRTKNITVLQHKRLSSLFSNDGGERWHDIDAKKTWLDKLLRRFHPVKFPYMPKSR